MSDERAAMVTRSRSPYAAVLLTLATLSAPGAACAAGFDRFVGFGDSTMDSGYFLYNSTGGSLAPVLIGTSTSTMNAAITDSASAGGTGTFTGPGVMNTTLSAARFGLTALPVRSPSVGGTNYANGSVQTVSYTMSPLGNNYSSGFTLNVPTSVQISNYLASVNNVADPHALYMISTAPMICSG